jgi:hypothetical protein
MQQTLLISIYPDLAASTNSLVPRLGPYMWRRLVLPARIGNWSLTSLQQRLVKTDGPFGQAYALLLAAARRGHLTRRLFGSMLGRIAMLPAPAG